MTLGLDQSMTNALINISIADDVLTEGIETFQTILSIVGTNLPNITVNPNMATVSIEDDDCKSTQSKSVCASSLLLLLMCTFPLSNSCCHWV